MTVIADSARGAIPIATLEAPCLVGELGALAHLQRSATVRARTPVTRARIGRSALAEVARTTPSLLIDVIGRMGDRLRRFNDAIGLYTHALEALERHEFDPALLEELRNPIPDLADFGHTFGRMAEQILLRRQRSDEMASAAVIQRALLPKPEEFAAETGIDASASMNAGARRRRRLVRTCAADDGRVAVGVGDVCGKGVPAALFTGITKTLIRINLRENPDLPGAILKANAYLANNNAARAVRDHPLRRLRSADRRDRAGELRPPAGADPARRRRGREAVRRRASGRPVRDPEADGCCGPRCAPGDLLFLYTDGVTEAENEAERRIRRGAARRTPRGTARLAARRRGSPGWRTPCATHASGRPQFDDITCVALLR